MKGLIAMQKMDLLSDEYVREAEIDTDTPVVISEKGQFGKKFARFMNSPVGVAMLCAVVSLSVLFAVVMVGRNGVDGPQNPPTPAGSLIEQESVQPNDETRAQTDHEADTTDETTPPEEDTKPTPSINLIPDTDVYKLSEFLDGEGFVSGLDLSTFKKVILNQYRYENFLLSKFPYKQYGWGVIYEGRYFDFEQSRNDHGNDHYTMTSSIETRISLRGLILPYGILFGDTYAKVCEKMGAAGQLDFTDAKTVVYEDENITLSVVNTDEATGYIRHLIYEETASYEKREVLSNVVVRSRDMVMKRTLTLSFLPDGTLGCFSMKSEETFHPEITEVLTPPDEDISSAEEAAALKAKVYAVLDTLEYDPDDSYVLYSYFPPTYFDEDLYDVHFRTLGKEAIPYILQYVMESPYSMPPTDGLGIGEGTWIWEEDLMNNCYFVSAAYTLLDMPYPYDGWYGYVEGYYAPRIYAAELYKHLHEYIDTDPAFWGSYTPAEGSFYRNDPLPLTDQKISEIKEAFFNTMIPEESQKRFTVDDLSLRYFGHHSGGSVVFVDGILDYTQEPTTETIYTTTHFSYESSQRLWYYKDGHFYTLTEAADAGLLTQYAAWSLHSIYDSLS